VAKRKPPTGKASAVSAKPSDVLNVAVTFRRPADKLGLTKFPGRMTAEAVSAFRPAPDNVSEAILVLKQHGFTVTGMGAMTLSVRVTRADFERVFGTALVERTVEDSHGTPSAKSFFAPPDVAAWSPIPELTNVIDDAYIQWPHIYMSQRFPAAGPSLFPPRVTYHHLRVPGDLVATLNVARVHRQGCTGRGVRVVMIDSGFAHGHPYFQENGYNTSVALAPGAAHDDRDGNGHGTGESANLLAVAPDATFIGVKLDNEDTGGSATILEGLQEAMRHNPQVISVSLGYDLVQTGAGRVHLTTLPNWLKGLEAEIQAAVAAGVVVVFSAGNGHVSFPGMMPEVISAGGVYVDDKGGTFASDYASAFASKIYSGRNVPDLCGLVGLSANHADYIMLPIEPNCEIDRDVGAHDGTAPNDGWAVFSGTSAAAPQLAGVCALLLQKRPSLKPAEIKGILIRTAADVDQGSSNAASNQGVAMTATPGDDGATGAGLVDAFAAWSQA
jgi:hypothetical protein